MTFPGVSPGKVYLNYKLFSSHFQYFYLFKMNQEQNYLPSLITATPMEGRKLAITLARKSIAAIQTDSKAREFMRSNYAFDTKQLIASAQVIALEFQTIAAANNYWKDF